jgi:predicted RNA-binding Zn ribbon-like protein
VRPRRFWLSRKDLREAETWTVRCVTCYTGYVLWLTARDGHRFSFDPGHLCLTFVYTGGEGPYAVFETLHTPDDLAWWLAESDLAVTVEPPSQTDLEHAKRLRQSIWLSANRLAHAQPLDPPDLEVLNAAAAHAPLVPRIEHTASGASSSWVAPATTRQALSTLARDAIDLFSGPNAARIRECEGVNCTLTFVDTSRPGARRWCSMERCGNRAKIRAHRSRLQQR